MEEKFIKKSFEMLAGECLSSLLHGDPINQCLLPTGLNEKGYFVFDPSQRCVQARTCLLEFVSTVKDAITSLHEKKIVHLDIRLENICFDVNSLKALLIDCSIIHYYHYLSTRWIWEFSKYATLITSPPDLDSKCGLAAIWHHVGAIL